MVEDDSIDGSKRSGGDRPAQSASDGSVRSDGAGDRTAPSVEQSSTDTDDLTAVDVAERYDFENFGPAELRQMDLEEWEAAFDPDSWITGPELLDRVEAELRSRVADREVFAVVDRPDEHTVLASSDTGFARVDADGGVTGSGTVLRDVKPTVALCSMPEYDVTEPPANASLPDPAGVPEPSGRLGNWMLQAVAASMLIAGIVLLATAVLVSLGNTAIVAVVAGLGFILAGVFLFLTVANARLASRFRAEEFRNRLRAAGVDDADRPAVLGALDRERSREEE